MRVNRRVLRALILESHGVSESDAHLYRRRPLILRNIHPTRRDELAGPLGRRRWTRKRRKVSILQSDQRWLQQFLNGRLTVTLIALELDLLKQPTLRLSDEQAEALPFLPHRVASARDGAAVGNLGLGVPTCSSMTVTLDEEGAGDLRFGLSMGTVQDAYDRRETEIGGDPSGVAVATLARDGAALYAGPGGHCLSLWRTEIAGVAVLAVEELRHARQTPPTSVSHTRDALASLVARVTGIGAAELTLAKLGLGVAGEDASRPLTDLMAISSESVRGEQWVRALSVVAQAGLQPLIGILLGDGEDFDSIEERQEVGYSPSFSPLKLGSQPAVAAAGSAASIDGRLVAMNLDSMSVWHDYLGVHSEHLIAATIPVLCDLAAIEVPFDRLRQAVGGDKPAPLSTQLRLLAEARLARVKRRLRRPTPGREQAAVWTNAGQVASFVDEAFDAKRDLIDEVTSECAAIIESLTAMHHQEREAWLSRAMAWLTVAATLFAAFSVFAGIAAMPRVPWAWLNDYAIGIGFGPVLLLAAVLIPWWIRRPKAG